MAEVVNGAGINEAKAHVPHNHSRFPLKELVADTHRFGEYHPHFVMDGIAGDIHPFRSIHDARSYSLKAPLMQDIHLNKDYFLVTLRSILPLQAERVVAHPNIGDDVPADVYTCVENFCTKVNSCAESFLNLLDSNDSEEDNMTRLMKAYILLESVYSYGSLLSSLGCSLSDRLFILHGLSGKYFCVDDYIEKICSALSSAIAGSDYFEATIDNTPVRVVASVEDIMKFRISDGNTMFIGRYITLRDFMQSIRDTGDWRFTGFNGEMPFTDFFDENDALVPVVGDIPLDLARVWAYQLSIAEYFTNDKVDYIYSADLFRQYIANLIKATTGECDDQFTWNGSYLFYDNLSAHYFDSLVANFDPTAVEPLQYMLSLFGFKRSLRFKDYFTGSRTRPLASVTNRANTDVSVNANLVSVIDVTRSIQVQRFLNAVNAAGRKFGEYIDSIFGVRPNKDMHEPIYLAQSTDTLFPSSVENTGAAQLTQANSVTAVFRGGSNNFEYKVDINEPCIIIGVTSYDIERFYKGTISRNFFIRDRFDMFLPQMQYIGDQPVYVHELAACSVLPFGSAFGYQFRDMQYKQLYPRCAGGFATGKLPGYAFMYRPDPFGLNNISPDFIRAKNSELDEFYVSLTSYSLGHYFHFILVQTNVDDTSRPMAAQPQIL